MGGKSENVQSFGLGGEVREQPLLRRLEGYLWRRVFSGFLVLIPVLVTFFILKIVYDYVESVFSPAIVYWLGEKSPLNFAGFGVVVTLFLLYFIGSFFSGQKAQKIQDAVLTKVPIVSPIYRVARQAVDTLSSPQDQRFRRAVFVDWPRQGVKAMGFVTSHLNPKDERDETIAVVYIPTVPNPTSGMLAWVPESEIVETEYTVEEPMKAVLSGGIVLPEQPALQGLSTYPSATDPHGK